MKTMSVLFACITLAFSVNAQTTLNQGTINYEQVVKLDIQLEGDAAQLAGQLPKERRSNKELLFTPDATVYKNASEAADDVNMDSEQGHVMVKMVEPQNILFTDLKKGTKAEQREFMTRLFLIDDKTEPLKWKITGNQKTILNYPCQEAVTEVDSQTVVAWFTPLIPVASGPGRYGNLPGMILAVDINNGSRTLTATSISDKVDASLLVKPKKGKKMTQPEFDEMVKEKMKEQGMEGGGGGTQMIIRISQ